MIKNYFKIAWRNLLKNKFYSVINITGLSVGLAVGLLILLWVKDELSFDRFNSRADSIFAVNSQLGTGSSQQVWYNVQPPLAIYGLKEVPGIESAARIAANRTYSIFRYKDKILDIGSNGNLFVDPSIFKMFSFKWVRGNPGNPFPTIQSIIITESTAKKYFDEADPVGKVLLADNKDNYTVSGVIEDFPDNSSIKADMLFSMDVRRNQYPLGKAKSIDEDWDNFYAVTYLQLQPGISPQTVMTKLKQVHMEHHPGKDAADVSYLAQPLLKAHLYDAYGNATGMQTVRVFIIVAMLILLIACINYVNLSTARAMLRSREVSVRKIIGAERKQLFAQFVIETLLVFSIALVLAFILIAFLMPAYNAISSKQMQFSLFNADIWKMVGLTMLATLAASSIYPALLLSSFKPINALKGKISLSIGSVALRRGLVICQFVFSIGLIIGTLIINAQLKFIREKDLGYNKSYVFSFPMRAMQPNFEAIRSQLINQPGVIDVASANDNIITANNTTSDTQWDGKDPNQSFLIHPINVDQHYLNFFQLKMEQGAGFTGMATDSIHYVLNETAVREAGIKDPVGKRFSVNFINGTIVGVVKDFHFASLKQKIEPAIFVYKRNCSRMYVRTTGRDAQTAINAVEQTWKQYNPGFPFEYKFMDEYYDKLYKTDTRSGALFNIFTGIAILISCLGLFSLATYTAQVKVKEIGIRKVLGASVMSITTMLSKDFLVLIIASILVATPISWYAMSKWLEDYTYRIRIGFGVFLIAGLAALLIAFATIIFQSVKAALANPVKSLRSE